MSADVTIGRGSVLVLAGSVLVAGVAVASGAFLGGYLLGDTPPPPPPTELAEKTYTVADLEAAMDDCKIENASVVNGVLELDSTKHRAPSVECFVVEIGAPAIAIEELESITQEPLEAGEYEWSNLHLSWVHARANDPEKWRDVTVTLR